MGRLIRMAGGSPGEQPISHIIHGRVGGQAARINSSLRGILSHPEVDLVDPWICGSASTWRKTGSYMTIEEDYQRKPGCQVLTGKNPVPLFNPIFRGWNREEVPHGSQDLHIAAFSIVESLASHFHCY